VVRLKGRELEHAHVVARHVLDQQHGLQCGCGPGVTVCVCKDASVKQIFTGAHSSLNSQPAHAGGLIQLCHTLPCRSRVRHGCPTGQSSAGRRYQRHTRPAHARQQTRPRPPGWRHGLQAHSRAAVAGRILVTR
jgi:hypothetical protein